MASTCSTSLSSALRDRRLAILNTSSFTKGSTECVSFSKLKYIKNIFESVIIIPQRARTTQAGLAILPLGILFILTLLFFFLFL